MLGVYMEALEIDPSSGYCSSNGVFYSKRGVLPPPEYATGRSDVTTFVLSRQKRCKIALIDAATGVKISYSELRRATETVAAGLQNFGVRHGDVVLVVASNFLHFPALSLGIMAVGAVLSTANPLYTATDIRNQVVDSNPVVIFTTADLLHKFTGIDIDLFLIGDAEEKTSMKYHSLEKMLGLEEGRISLPIQPIRPEDNAVLFYSSGTTGKSKGVVSTHANLVAMTRILQSVIDKEGVYLGMIPLFHMYGFSMLVCGVLAAGGTVVMSSTLTVEGMLKAVERCRITHIPTVPTILTRLCKLQGSAVPYDTRCVKEIMVSGSATGKQQMEKFARLFPGIGLLQIYGLTETSGPTIWSQGNDIANYGSAGTLLPNIEAKVVDIDNGKPLPPGMRGELCFRGPMIMKGYYKQKEAKLATIDSQGWFHTGDICYINQQGRIYLVDRIKELIKCRGLQVAPVELEEILLSHPEIEDSAVMPYPDEDAGEIPMAFIVKQNGSNLTGQDVMDFVATKVAPYKKIRRVAFIDFIPRSTSGKILRIHLKSQINEQNQSNISRL